MTYLSAFNNERPFPDQLLTDIATYVTQTTDFSEHAYKTATLCLMDALGCALLALRYPACTALLGPIVKETVVPHGARVPGTGFVLDPILAAFNIGTLIRWLDFNDTWLAAEWGHPSDNLGAILAVGDYCCRQLRLQNKPLLTMRTILTAMIKAYEIQGILSLNNSLNQYGFDHVAYVKIASSALACQLLGGSKDDIIAVLSHAFIDGMSLRTYRHAPNTGPRKSWAAGDASSRGVRLAWLVKQGEMGYPCALTAKKWGFYEVINHSHPFTLTQSLGSYVIENILFKIAYPAEFHAQTAIECAILLHKKIGNHLDQVKEIIITTQLSAMRIINKTGPLHNPADRDHCLQYMVAVALLFGELKAEYYENNFAAFPAIDILRDKMRVEENPDYSASYLDANKRFISNAIEIIFDNDLPSEKIEIDCPLGHVRRRDEGIPLLIKKFNANLSPTFSSSRIQELIELFNPKEKKLANMPIDTFMEKWIN